ncbi:sensor histidine kinase [Chloroflexota bacterium]
MARRTLLITYIATYTLIVASIIRYVVRFRDYRIWSIALLMGYLILLFAEPFFIRRNRLLPNIYLSVQTVIICTISIITPNADYWSGMFIPLVVQVMHKFPQRTGFLITGIFTIIMTILMLLGPGLVVGLPLIFVNGIAYFLFAAFIAIIREAETARDQSQGQLAELLEMQEALRQSELEKAITEERSRLARNLHDSVTQSIFSVTLTAEAAKILITRDKEQAVEQLDRLLELSGSALAEMRSLIFELRPTAIAELGFLTALYIAHLDENNNLKIDLHVQGEPNLVNVEAQRLFFIIREAINNIVKHAQVNEARITLDFGNDKVLLVVEDYGKGFDPLSIDPTKNKMGLSSMRERVEKFGGTFLLDSRQGVGTKITVEIPVSEEIADDN